MTLAEIAKLDKEILTPAQVAPLLSCDPDAIRGLAATPEGREQLGFEVLRIRSRTKIPRRKFLEYMGWKGTIE